MPNRRKSDAANSSPPRCAPFVAGRRAGRAKTPRRSGNARCPKQLCRPRLTPPARCGFRSAPGFGTCGGKRSGAVGRRRPRREARFPNRRRNQQKLGDAKLPHAKKLLLSQNAFQALCGAKRIYFRTQHMGREGVSDVSVQKL